MIIETVLLLLPLLGRSELVTTYEFENVVGGAGYPRSPWRSAASENSSLQLFEGDKVVLTLCSIELVSINIDNFNYSNDGSSDDIEIKVNGKEIGNVTTEETTNGLGTLWNDFKTSGPIGSSIQLDKGNHTLTFDVKSADCYGTEFDSITISSDLHVKPSWFWCGETLIKSPTPSLCAQEIDAQAIAPTTLQMSTTTVSPNATTEEPAKFVEQLSTETECLDSPNVKVRFHPRSLKNTEINVRSKPSTTLPLRKRKRRNRRKNTSVCQSTIWQIGTYDEDNAELGPTASTVQLTFNVNGQTLFPGTIIPSQTNKITILFTLPSGMDTDGGLYVSLGLINVTSPTNVGLQYVDQSTGSPSELQYHEFNPNVLFNVWNIESGSISPDQENQIVFVFDETYTTPLLVDFLRMDSTKRPQRLKRSNIFKDNTWKVIGLSKRGRKKKTSQGMEVVVNGKAIKGTFAKVILKKKPKFRLLTIDYKGLIYPHHSSKKLTRAMKGGGMLSDVSAVMFGTSDAIITKIELDLEQLFIFITYDDGVFVKLSFNYTPMQTELKLLSDNLESPAITFVSTKVSDSVAAVNEMVVDGVRRRDLFDKGISRARGRKFSFIRTSPNPTFDADPEVEVSFPDGNVPV